MTSSNAECTAGEQAADPENGVIGWVRGRTHGPLLLCIGGLHGNEPAGVRALEALIGPIRARRAAMAGDFVAVVGNMQAVAADRRFLSYDMNRAWIPGRARIALTAQGNGEGPPPGAAPEDAEMARMRRILDWVAARRRGPVHVLDLHTTSGRGGTFTTTADLPRNRRFAMEIPVPLVLGLSEHLEGTLLGYLDQLGYTTTACECGQHREAYAVTRARAAIWLAMRAARLLPEAAVPEADHGHRVMRAARRKLSKVFTTVHRHPVAPEDRYRTRPGFRNFQRIRAGEIVGDDRHGEVPAPHSGRLLMPLYQELGDDGFFVVREVEQRREKARPALAHAAASPR